MNNKMLIILIVVLIVLLITLTLAVASIYSVIEHMQYEYVCFEWEPYDPEPSYKKPDRPTSICTASLEYWRNSHE